MSDAGHAYELSADETVPADAAEYLEALEDAADAIAARRALAEQAPSVPAQQVWAELGVDDNG
jgi:hypothetical protein